MERITYPGSGLSKGNVMQVMTTVAEYLAYCMAEGQSVTLDGIGTFTPRLGVAKDKEIDSLDGDEPKRNARSIEVNGINYRADKELVRETNLRCDLRRGGQPCMEIALHRRGAPDAGIGLPSRTPILAHTRLHGYHRTKTQ